MVAWMELTGRWKTGQIFCQQRTCVNFWFSVGQILVPEPVHSWPVHNACVFVLLITSVLILVGWEMLWVAGHWDVQDLANDARKVLVARFL